MSMRPSPRDASMGGTHTNRATSVCGVTNCVGIPRSLSGVASPRPPIVSGSSLAGHPYAASWSPRSARSCVCSMA